MRNIHSGQLKKGAESSLLFYKAFRYLLVPPNERPEAEETARIAAVRIHVERAVGRI